MKYQILGLLLILGVVLSASIKVNNDITVGGLSSGAFMAAQMHVIHSATIRGASIFAGGPYYCAKGELEQSLTSCMSTGEGVNITTLENTIEDYFLNGQIDSPTNLNNSKAFIFSGTEDQVVNPKVVRYTENLYEDYFVETKHVYDFFAGHTMPTKNYGVNCTQTQSPFIGNCDYNGAFESLNFLFSDKLTESGTEAKKSNIFSVAQKTSGTVMDSKAYIYAPEACQQEGADCPLHVVFHGCMQTTSDINMQYVENTGYNEVAEANNLIILYPQAVKSMLKNPNGCWDWWGYTDLNYANKDGKQMAEVSRLIEGLKNGDLPVSSVYDNSVEEFLKNTE